MPELPLSKLFVLLVLMTGPLRVVPAFASLTGSLGATIRNRLALRGVVFAAIGILLAVFVGHPVLKAWDTTPQALTAATGLLLLFTALQALVGWPPSPASSSAPVEETLDMGRLALSPLAFPIIVPPFAVGVLVLFAAFFPDFTSQCKMLAVAYGLLLVDYVAMRGARRILAVIGSSTLQLLGAVFGVLQLALAVQMVFWAVKSTFVAP
ncbi:MAG: MarC family protein [Cyanobacteriota bacterium]